MCLQKVLCRFGGDGALLGVGLCVVPRLRLLIFCLSLFFFCFSVSDILLCFEFGFVLFKHWLDCLYFVLCNDLGFFWK